MQDVSGPDYGQQQESEAQEWQEVGEYEFLAKMAERGNEAIAEMESDDGGE